jgi:hypothetical protein
MIEGQGGSGIQRGEIGKIGGRRRIGIDTMILVRRASDGAGMK